MGLCGATIEKLGGLILFLSAKKLNNMKISLSLQALAFLATTLASHAFVVPQAHVVRSGSVAMASAASNESDSDFSVGDAMKAVGFSALFAISMVANPLPSFADGK